MTSTETLGSGVGAAGDDVTAFASAVRARLDDLPAEEVEDLVDGLEADLIERREDSDEPLGDPLEYADELRAAAGLPPRNARPSGGEWFGAYKRLWRNGSAWVRERRENPAVATVLDFLLALRPVWWVLRGWVAFAVTVMFTALTPIPDTAVGWGGLAAFVIVSVQWGRGRWLGWRWSRALKIAVTVVVLIALPFTIGRMVHTVALASADDAYAEEVSEMKPIGVNANGNPVTNLFVFDCEGNPLSGVQVFDQDGEPFTLDDYGPDADWLFGVDERGREIAIVPNPNTTGGAGWNVFPLLQADIDEEYRPDLSSAEEPRPPFAAVQPLAGEEGTCAPSDDAASTDGGAGTDESPPVSSE